MVITVETAHWPETANQAVGAVPQQKSLGWGLWCGSHMRFDHCLCGCPTLVWVSQNSVQGRCSEYLDFLGLKERAQKNVLFLFTWKCHFFSSSHNFGIYISDCLISSASNLPHFCGFPQFWAFRTLIRERERNAGKNAYKLTLIEPLNLWTVGVVSSALSFC